MSLLDPKPGQPTPTAAQVRAAEVLLAKGSDDSRKVIAAGRVLRAARKS